MSTTMDEPKTVEEEFRFIKQFESGFPTPDEVIAFAFRNRGKEHWCGPDDVDPDDIDHNVHSLIYEALHEFVAGMLKKHKDAELLARIERLYDAGAGEAGADPSARMMLNVLETEADARGLL
jgi:hypothetical protein